MLEILLLISLTLLALVGLVGNIIGLPGSWLIVLMAVLCLTFAPPDGRVYVGWTACGVIVLIALLGELLEFAASAVGASRVGGTKRGTVLAIVGSIAGAVVGLFFGALIPIPIPILSSVIASLLLGASGAFAGSVVGERWAGRDWHKSLEVGGAAFWGRLLGTVGKAVCGTIACAVFLLAIWI